MFADQPLDRAAEVLSATATAGRSVVTALRDSCPQIYRQLRADAQHPGLLSLWGRSVNIDENAGLVIVDPAILHALGQIAGVRMRGRIVHAGLQHTYGYLLSNIVTPYGRKRNRWITPDLERGFGIEESLLSERPKQGTLLANVTWFIGQLAFRGATRRLAQLQADSKAVARSLVDFDYARLKVQRMVETVVLDDAMPRSVRLYTDLAAYPHPPRDTSAESTLLIYSAQVGKGMPRLITVFPMRSTDARELLRAARPGRKVPIRVRYNGYVRGLEGRGLLGRRELE